MAKREILTAPDPRLRIKAKVVERVDDHILGLLQDMVDTMCAEEHPAGLAATQVGIDYRLIVMLVDDRPCKIINPTIVWSNTETSVMKEYCYSVPEYGIEVERPTEVHVEYLNEHNEKIFVKADGFLARCFQHEMDHLDGKLSIDYLSPLKKNMMLKKLERIKKHTS